MSYRSEPSSASPPASVDEVLPMILIILIAPRQRHTLRAIVRLASYACNMGEMRAPLPARHAVCPLCSYQDSRVVDRIVLSCDWSKVVGGDGDKDAAAAGIGEASFLCSLGCEGLHREDYMGLSIAARRVQKDVGAGESSTNNTFNEHEILQTWKTQSR